MADAMTETNLMFVDKRRAEGLQTNPYSSTLTSNTRDIAALRARLAAISGYYTATVLDKMTRNDMIYAIRINDEPTGLNW